MFKRGRTVNLDRERAWRYRASRGGWGEGSEAELDPVRLHNGIHEGAVNDIRERMFNGRGCRNLRGCTALFTTVSFRLLEVCLSVM